MKRLGIAAAVGFVASIVIANWLTTRYGNVGVGLGLTATAGTYAAGCALGLRDVIHEALGKYAMFAVILVGAGVSFALADGRLAVASAVALLVSEVTDWLVYGRIRDMKPAAVLASNTAGAIVDTLVFLWIAAPFLSKVDPDFTFWGNVPGQVVGKVVWATLVPLGLIYAVRSGRAVPSNRLRPEGA